MVNTDIARKNYEKYMKWKIPKGYEVHHIKPRKKGGSDKIENLVLINKKYHNHTYMHCWQKKNPSKEELLIEEVILSFYTTLKESKIRPEPVITDEYEQFTKDHKNELIEMKLNGWSNKEIVEYKPFERKLGSEETFRVNRKNLGFDKEVFDDRENGIMGQRQSGKNNHMYGKTGKDHPNYGNKYSEETRKLLSKINTGKNNPMYNKNHSEETKQIQSEKAKKVWSQRKANKNMNNSKIAVG